MLHLRSPPLFSVISFGTLQPRWQRGLSSAPAHCVQRPQEESQKAAYSPQKPHGSCTYPKTQHSTAEPCGALRDMLTCQVLSLESQQQGIEVHLSRE